MQLGGCLFGGNIHKVHRRFGLRTLRAFDECQVTAGGSMSVGSNSEESFPRRGLLPVVMDAFGFRLGKREASCLPLGHSRSKFLWPPVPSANQEKGFRKSTRLVRFCRFALLLRLPGVPCLRHFSGSFPDCALYHFALGQRLVGLS